MEQIILCKNGEIVLKGLNRRYFEEKLMANIKKSIAPFGCFDVYGAQSTIYIEAREKADLEQAFTQVKKVFGVAAVVKAYKLEKDLQVIRQACVELMGGLDSGVRTFKAEAKRSDKKFALSSPEICALVGGDVLAAHPHLSVDVYKPDVTLFVEVRDYNAFAHLGKEPAAGGMPYGTGGKGLLLLSGGIDSPVAGYMMAKRGVQLSCIHFFSHPYTSERAKKKVMDLAKILCGYAVRRLDVHVVPFTEIQEQIRGHCREDLFTIIMRRFMMRISERLAQQSGMDALITGESLAQVASQTIKAIGVTNEAVELPVLRPLIGMDKQEIVEISRKIGAFETSIQPYEDCCTVFTPRHPKTSPKLSDVIPQEQKLDCEDLIDRAVAGIETVSVEA